MFKKTMMLFLMASLFTSCLASKSIDREVKNEEKQEAYELVLSEYMSDEDIVRGINDPVTNEKQLEYSDPKLRSRIDGLIKDEIFLREMKVLDDLGVKEIPNEEKALSAADGQDLRVYNSSVKNQNNGLCTAYATVGAIEGTLCMSEGKCSQNLSEQHLFQRQGRQYSTTAAVETAAKYRIVDEDLWPQYGKAVSGVNSKGHAKILEYRYLGKDPQALMDAHDRGNFVVIGMKTPKDMLSCRSTIRTGTKFSSGGHAILSSGYKRTTAIPGGMYSIIKNSWGKSCGDSGYQYVPLKDICNKGSAYCFFYEVVTVNSNKGAVVTPVDPDKKPRWAPYCSKVTFRFWTRKFYDQFDKNNRCYYKCEKNCESVCDGQPTCKAPWRK